MEVTHPEGATHYDSDGESVRKKGDICLSNGAGFDSLMLRDFQTIKAWSKSPTRCKTPSFVKDTISSVAGYSVALITRGDCERRGELWVDH